MSYARHTASRNHKRVRKTNGNITLNGATWQEIAAESGGPGTGGFDLTLWAQVGDVLMGWMSATLASTAVAMYFDLHTIVSSAGVNSFALNAAIPGSGVLEGMWYAPASQEVGVGQSPVLYTVVAGDLVASGGATKVTVRPMFIGASATARTLYADTASGPLFAFNLLNLGPVQT